MVHSEWAKTTKVLEAAKVNTARNIIAQNGNAPDDMANAALALEAETVPPEVNGYDAIDALTALAEPAPPMPLPKASLAPPKTLKLNVSLSKPAPKPAPTSALPLPVATIALPPATPSSSSTPKPKTVKLARPAKPLVPIHKAPPAKPSAPVDEDVLLAELDMIEAEKTHTPSPTKKAKVVRAPSPELIAIDDLLGPIGKSKKDRPAKRKHAEGSNGQLTRPATPLNIPSSSSSSAPSSSRKPGDTPTAPMLKLKVKAKESTPSVHHHDMPVDATKCKAIIRHLKKDAYNAAPFLLPVDAVAQGCPT